MQNTLDIVNAYYDSWKRGGGADDARLRKVLAPDLLFEGPLRAARSTDAFVAGLTQFASGLRAFRLVQLVATGNEASALYDCDCASPEGTFRFAEFFQVEGGAIRSIRLVYDASKFRKT